MLEADCATLEHRGRCNAAPGGMVSSSMTKAIWNGIIIAESDRTQVVDGYTYFPPEQVRREHLRDSAKHTGCAWKGTASYYDVVAGGQVNRDAAWYYPQPKDAARHIAGWIGFWRGVEIVG